MAKKQSGIFELLVKALTPIIMKDKDIIEFLEKNDLEPDDKAFIVMWLASNAAGYYLYSTNKEKYAAEIKKAGIAQGEAEVELAKKYDDINEILQKVIKDNIQEWFEIFHESLKKANVESEDSDEVSEDDDIVKIIDFYQKLLFPIIIREDDVTEFAGQYEQDVANLVVNYICIGTLLKWSTEVLGFEDQDFKDPFAKNAKAIQKRLTQTFVTVSKKLVNNIDNPKKFMAGVQEIIEDHLKEFVKKMYKAYSKLMEEK